MEQVRGDFCYILLITRIFNKEDVKEAHRRVGVTFIKAGYASYSEAVVDFHRCDSCDDEIYFA